MKTLKPATGIMLLETRTLHHAGASEKSAESSCSLADKIEELVLKIGYTNAQALSVVIQLLTVGKIRVDFRDYSQRLQLASKSDMMTRAHAAEIFDAHLVQMKVETQSRNGFTQKITFQSPRVHLP
jgi:murein L,D-transpeptidase YcbB/YkuD